MAVVDQFLLRHVQGALEPGEAVMATGLMRRQRRTSGQHVVWDDFLAVATDRRLVVFETETGGVFTPTAKPVARNPAEWRYEDLAQVVAEPVFGITSGVKLRLGCHPYLGPVASSLPPDAEGRSGGYYDIFAGCDDLDGQAAFHAQYPTWLQQRVQAGAFPLPPQKRAWVESKMTERRAAIAAEQQRVLQRAAERDAKIRAGVAAAQGAWTKHGHLVLSVASLIFVLLTCLGGAGAGGILMADPIEFMIRGRKTDDEDMIQLGIGAAIVVVSLLLIPLGLWLRKKVMRGPLPAMLGAAPPSPPSPQPAQAS